MKIFLNAQITYFLITSLFSHTALILHRRRPSVCGHPCTDLQEGIISPCLFLSQLLWNWGLQKVSMYSKSGLLFTFVGGGVSWFWCDFLFSQVMKALSQTHFSDSVIFSFICWKLHKLCFWVVFLPHFLSYLMCQGAHTLPPLYFKYINLTHHTSLSSQKIPQEASEDKASH